jgi:hypothetical protein
VSATERAELASIAAVLLALVLAWSAAAKWNTRGLTVVRFARLGVPRPGIIVPAVIGAEAVTVVALLTSPVIGGLLAVGLLSAFTVFLVVAIRRGVTVGCGCFGAADDRPVGAPDVARNVGLLTLAGLATSTTSLVRPGWDAVVLAGTVLLLALVATGLVELRHRVGPLWALPEPGELAGGRP